MSKQSSKSSGIRMPTELYSWVDRYAVKKEISRSQCVCGLVKIARRSLSTKASAKRWTVHVAEIGMFLSVVIITMNVECMLGIL